MSQYHRRVSWLSTTGMLGSILGAALVCGQSISTPTSPALGEVYGPFVYPTAWTGLEPEIHYTSDGLRYRYADSDDFRGQHMVASTDAAAVGNVTYYVATDGNDGNAGTKASPLLTIGAAQAKADVLTIMVKAGRYNKGISITTKSINIIGYDGEVYICPTGAGVAEAVITVNATYSNVWDCTSAFALNTPSSGQLFESNKVPGVLKRAASIQAVSETPNSYFISVDGLTVYVNSRSAPALLTDIFLPLLNWQNTLFNNGTACRVYLEGLHFIGGLFAQTNAAGHKVAAQRCSFVHGNGTSGPLWLINVAEAYFNDCVIGYSENDGADYEGTGAWTKTHIESNCHIRSCGLSGGGSSQTSSAHGDVRMLRVGGDYEAGSQDAILDVGDDGQTLNLGVEIFGTASAQAIGNGASREMWTINLKAGGNTQRLLNNSTNRHHIFGGDAFKMPREGTGQFDSNIQ